MRTPRGAVRSRLGRALPSFAVLAGCCARCAALLRGLARSAAGVWMSRSMADRKAASVLPDPVGAMTSAFSPRRIAVQARAWTDVGPSGKAEANQARVAGAKPFSAAPADPGPISAGDPACPAGPIGPVDSPCPVNPVGPAGPVGPVDSPCPPGSTNSGSAAGPADPPGPADLACPAGSADPACPAGSSPPAVRMLTSSPVFPIFSSRRPVPGSHPASALLPPLSLSQPPLPTAPQSPRRRRPRVGIRRRRRKTELRQWSSDSSPEGVRTDEPDHRIRYRSGSSTQGGASSGKPPDTSYGAQRPTVRLLLQGDPNSPHRGITYR